MSSKRFRSPLQWTTMHNITFLDQLCFIPIWIFVRSSSPFMGRVTYSSGRLLEFFFCIIYFLPYWVGQHPRGFSGWILSHKRSSFQFLHNVAFPRLHGCMVVVWAKTVWLTARSLLSSTSRGIFLLWAVPCELVDRWTTICLDIVLTAFLYLLNFI